MCKLNKGRPPTDCGAHFAGDDFQQGPTSMSMYLRECTCSSGGWSKAHKRGLEKSIFASFVNPVGSLKLWKFRNTMGKFSGSQSGLIE